MQASQIKNSADVILLNQLNSFFEAYFVYNNNAHLTYAREQLYLNSAVITW